LNWRGLRGEEKGDRKKDVRGKKEVKEKYESISKFRRGM